MTEGVRIYSLQWVQCGHPHCQREGKWVIAQDGASSTCPQTHDCCGRHRCKR